MPPAVLPLPRVDVARRPSVLAGDLKYSRPERLPCGPVQTPWPCAFASSQPPQYEPPSSNSKRPPFIDYWKIMGYINN
uniref:Uncharacterized protein n=1 Tax=Pristionchus pacificus TaxID=54126 RepID=A0A2A6BNG4_PRIPA|eukprot:PDM67356.1 hypothetical protein PRIPAC_48773 [Pristionchus pacificus]